MINFTNYKQKTNRDTPEMIKKVRYYVVIFIKVSNAHTCVCVCLACVLLMRQSAMFVWLVCRALPAHDIGARNARYSEIEREVVVCRCMYECLACG